MFSLFYCTGFIVKQFLIESATKIFPLHLFKNQQMRHLSLKFLSIFSLVILILTGCKKDDIDVRKEGLSDVSKYDAKPAVQWIDMYRNIVIGTGINPPRAARVYAYAGITLYESVVDGISGNRSLQGQLNGFNLNTIPANTDSLDYVIVLNEALSILAKCDTIIPNLPQSYKDNVDTLHDVILRTRFWVLDSIVVKSKARGVAVAQAIMKYAATDNFLTVKALPLYAVPPRDALHLWYWEPTDAAHLHPAEPYWGQMRPFVLDSSAEMEIPQSVAFTTDTASAFGRQAREVQETVNSKTNEQNNIVLWWRDQTFAQTPAGHWMGIVQYVLPIKGYKLDKAAELYALVGITTADAFISCWDAKYKYNLLRPETYIRAYIDPFWTTGQGSDITPTFPEYPSGHSVCSGAAAKVLTDALGIVAFTDSINVTLGYQPRSFLSFDQAAEEAAMSRLYGGIHYRDAIENGLQQGQNVGQKVTNTIHFR